MNVHSVPVSFSYQDCTLIARLSIQGKGNTGESDGCLRGEAGAGVSAAGLRQLPCSPCVYPGLAMASPSDSTAL